MYIQHYVSTYIRTYKYVHVRLFNFQYELHYFVVFFLLFLLSMNRFYNELFIDKHNNYYRCSINAGEYNTWRLA